MNITLNTKERMLLEDAKTHEELCVQKYSNYAQQAKDQQLKDICSNHAKIEQEHLNSINQLLSGQVPSMNNQQSGGNSNQQQQQQQQINVAPQPQNASTFEASDKDICTDLLMTEKYVSGEYNTTIFEFRDTNVRDVLNHIQKEEQKHGEAIFKYMESKGMYTPPQ